MQADLWANVYLTGGSSQFPGFLARVFVGPAAQYRFVVRHAMHLCHCCMLRANVDRRGEIARLIVSAVEFIECEDAREGNRSVER